VAASTGDNALLFLLLVFGEVNYCEGVPPFLGWTYCPNSPQNKR
jgi:hypothetical protein